MIPILKFPIASSMKKQINLSIFLIISADTSNAYIWGLIFFSQNFSLLIQINNESKLTFNCIVMFYFVLFVYLFLFLIIIISITNENIFYLNKFIFNLQIVYLREIHKKSVFFFVTLTIILFSVLHRSFLILLIISDPYHRLVQHSSFFLKFFFCTRLISISHLNIRNFVKFKFKKLLPFLINVLLFQ